MLIEQMMNFLCGLLLLGCNKCISYTLSPTIKIQHRSLSIVSTNSRFSVLRYRGAVGGLYSASGIKNENDSRSQSGFFGIPAVGRALMKAIFWRGTPGASRVLNNQTDLLANQMYEPKGFLAGLKLSFRRRLLNLWDRNPPNWRYAVSSDAADVVLSSRQRPMHLNRSLAVLTFRPRARKRDRFLRVSRSVLDFVTGVITRGRYDDDYDDDEDQLASSSKLNIFSNRPTKKIASMYFSPTGGTYPEENRFLRSKNDYDTEGGNNSKDQKVKDAFNRVSLISSSVVSKARNLREYAVKSFQNLTRDSSFHDNAKEATVVSTPTPTRSLFREEYFQDSTFKSTPGSDFRLMDGTIIDPDDYEVTLQNQEWTEARRREEERSLREAQYLGRGVIEAVGSATRTYSNISFSVLKGAASAAGGFLAGVNLPVMPWDKHYRSPIPFFENSGFFEAEKVLVDSQGSQSSQDSPPHALDSMSRSGVIIAASHQQVAVDSMDDADMESLVALVESGDNERWDEGKAPGLLGRVFPFTSRVLLKVLSYIQRRTDESEAFEKSVKERTALALPQSAGGRDGGMFDDGTLVSSTNYLSSTLELPDSTYHSRANSADVRVNDSDESVAMPKPRFLPRVTSSVFRAIADFIPIAGFFSFIGDIVAIGDKIPHKISNDHLVKVDIESRMASTAFDEEVLGLQDDIAATVRDDAGAVMPLETLEGEALRQYTPSPPSIFSPNLVMQASSQVLADATMTVAKVVKPDAIAAKMKELSVMAYAETVGRISSGDGQYLPNLLPVKTLEDPFEVSIPDSIQSVSVATETPPSSSSASNATNLAMSGVKIDRLNKDFMVRPPFIDEERIPVPTKADLAFLEYRRMARAVTAALVVTSERDAKEFLATVGIGKLFDAVISSSRVQAGGAATSSTAAGMATISPDARDFKVDALKGILLLLRQDRSVAQSIVYNKQLLEVVCDLMEWPLRGFRSLRVSQAEKDKEARAQRVATALVLRLVRSSDEAAVVLRDNSRLRKLLAQLAAQADVYGSPTRANGETSQSALIKPATLKPDLKKMLGGNGTIVDYFELKTDQMARISSWAIGGVPWKPKRPGQKGLRILSLDGGGSRGVLSITLLKEIMQRAGETHPYQVFDIICGTSTGGIIAALLGTQLKSIEETEVIYDEFISKVFATKSTLKLLTDLAAYEEEDLEKVLYMMCGDELMIDSNRADCPRVFFVSSKYSYSDPVPYIWRNYNYPQGQKSRYGGTFRVNTLTAVRATTAAPTLFNSVGVGNSLFGDGAIVANNPTAIALQEAKVLFPGVPVELVVSIGTGLYVSTELDKNLDTRKLSYDMLFNAIVAAAVAAEDVHALLADFLPTDKYFRFNPSLQENMAIDEKKKEQLDALKAIGRRFIKALETGDDGKRMASLVNTIRGSDKKS